jgi:hypothetical protein
MNRLNLDTIGTLRYKIILFLIGFVSILLPRIPTLSTSKAFVFKEESCLLYVMHKLLALIEVDVIE